MVQASMYTSHANQTPKIFSSNLADIKIVVVVPWIVVGQLDEYLSQDEINLVHRNTEWKNIWGFEHDFDLFYLLDQGMDGPLRQWFTTPPGTRYIIQPEDVELMTPWWREKNTFPHHRVELDMDLSLTPPSGASPGPYTINTNAVFNNRTELATYAGLVKQPNGDWKEAYYGYLGNVSPLQAHLTSILKGLEFFQTNNINQCKIKTHNCEALYMIKYTNSEDGERYQAIVSQCRLLIEKTKTILQITFEDANECALWLANLSMKRVMNKLQPPDDDHNTLSVDSGSHYIITDEPKGIKQLMENEQSTTSYIPFA